ncbi:MAG: 2-hydroxyacid dehydrogenase [Verrucomicrobiales bacterium]
MVDPAAVWMNLRRLRAVIGDILGCRASKHLHARSQDATYVNAIMKVAFYDAKPYDREFFDEQNSDNSLEINYHSFRLSIETASTSKGCEAVCVFVNDALDRSCLEELANLGVKVVALRCAGFNNVDLTAASSLEIHVVRVPAYSPHAVAEYAVALVHTLNRRIHRAYNRVREHNFSLNGLVGHDMHGKTAGIVGTGKIGKLTAQILKGYGMRIIACDPYPDADWAGQNEIEYSPLEDLLPQSHLVSLHTPLTPDTHHLIDDEALNLMMTGAYLVNTSRGKLINTRALIGALKRKKLGGVALDVYEIEEGIFFEDLSQEGINDDELARLISFPNVLVTSHQGFLTVEALSEIARVTCTNLTHFGNGEPFLEGTAVTAD